MPPETPKNSWINEQFGEYHRSRQGSVDSALVSRVTGLMFSTLGDRISVFQSLIGICGLGLVTYIARSIAATIVKNFNMWS
ncbi:hypothetical protein BV25DRAFT_1830136 [Artomyces pyxidatus]|uniref:Uncharacterized protein n=1 Tax=Artomyces pyxidatus TaxID=48021 RepID=A0ACB8SR86_9AGAM|nr:hypothetical protein BV25DRAFT_1830136 [Artomyces pyxidatus]